MKPRNLNNAQGIDVSHHQGIIDWAKVKASGKVDFAFVKATEGIGYVDPQFKHNAAGVNAIGIPVGYYHYAHPETNKALDEARVFVEATKGQLSQLPYVLDLEGNEAAAIDRAILSLWAYTFMKEVKRLTNSNVMLYTGAYFARDQLNNILAEFPLWVAHYGAAIPLSNTTWKDWTVFQYSSTGSVPGINGNVDMNEYHGSVDELTKKFKDVPATYWAAASIADAVDAGIMQGYPDGTFKPDQPITRAEFAAAISKLNK
jgi:lysozyme